MQSDLLAQCGRDKSVVSVSSEYMSKKAKQERETHLCALSAYYYYYYQHSLGHRLKGETEVNFRKARVGPANYKQSNRSSKRQETVICI